jgi:hypothetical protein
VSLSAAELKFNRRLLDESTARFSSDGKGKKEKEKKKREPESSSNHNFTVTLHFPRAFEIDRSIDRPTDRPIDRPTDIQPHNPE